MDTCEEYSLKLQASQDPMRQENQQMVAENVPHIWCEFLSENINKADPFAFLSMHIVKPCKKRQAGDHNMPNKMSSGQTYMM